MATTTISSTAAAAAKVAAAAASGSGAAYAEALRRELIDSLGLLPDVAEGGDDNDGHGGGNDADGGGSGDGGGGGDDATVADTAAALDVALGAGSGQPNLAGLADELDALLGHDAVRDALERGRPPAEAAARAAAARAAAERGAVADYVAESGALIALHGQMAAADETLARMEELLSRFQSDLGRAADEIRALQAQSGAMAARLKNRRAVEAALGGFIESVAVPEDLVAGIMQEEVGEDYLEHLLALDRRLRFLASDAAARGSAAARDAEAVLAKLRARAVAKVREFLLARLYQLRKPKTNIPIIQQTVLLRHKYFVRFLREHAPDVHAELRAEYASVVSRVLAGSFRTYLAAMEKLQLPPLGPADVLGVPPDAQQLQPPHHHHHHAGGPGGSVGGAGGGGMGAGAGAAMAQLGGGMMAAVGGAMALFGRGTGRAASERVFELGDRAAVLGQGDAPAIAPHAAEVEGRRFPYEVVFRNVHKLLADAASAEFLFCLDFWADEPLFREIVAPAITVVEGDLHARLSEQWDALAVLLMIRLNAEARALMARRRVPALDDYLDRVDLALWPRFKVLWDLQHASLRAGAERALFPGDATGCAVAAPARRYAALVAGVLTLMAPHEEEGGVFKASALQEMLDRLWAAMFDLLLRTSNLFKSRRAGIVFLVLNYDHIRAAWRAADARPGGAAAGALGLLGAASLKECDDQLANCLQLYADDQLAAHFRPLVDFVRKAEQAAARAGAAAEGAPLPGFGPAEAAPVLADFSSKWKGALAAIQSETAAAFASSGDAARAALQATLTQLLLRYTRLLELLKRQGEAGAAAAREAVGVPAVMLEMRALTRGG